MAEPATTTAGTTAPNGTTTAAPSTTASTAATAKPNTTTSTAATTTAAGTTTATGTTAPAGTAASSDGNKNRGLPYYEKLRRELRDTLQKKRIMDKNLVRVDRFSEAKK